MGNTTNSYSKYVKYRLANFNTASVEIKKPVGWNDNGLDSARNKKYHGVLTEVTDELSFVKEDKDYILNEYNLNGMLSNVGLIRSVLKEDNDEVKFVSDDILYADFNTMVIKDNVLKIKFNTNRLMDLLDSHDSNDFELETLTSIDNVEIPPMEENFVEIKGRSILNSAEHNFTEKSYVPENIGDSPGWSPLHYYRSIRTELISQGESRNSTAYVEDKDLYSYSNLQHVTSSWLFFDNSTSQVDDTNIHVRYKMTGLFRSSALSTDVVMSIIRVKYTPGTGLYSVVDEQVLKTWTQAADPHNETFNLEGIYEKTLEYDQGLMLVMYGTGFFRINVTPGFGLSVNDVAFYESSPALNFVFLHDVFKRLLTIITSETDRFYSSYLGRTEAGYEQDGEGGLLGIMSGMWARAFSKTSEKYKSPIISLENALKSCSSVLALGAGVEVNEHKERLIVEDLSFFYRDEVVVRFPNKISNVVRKVDAKSFYSGLEFGYSNSTASDADRMGLDEPNRKVLYTSPIHNTKNKFIKLSKIRADEYEMEELRRKPQSQYPDESLSSDNFNWFLDLKRKAGLDNQYEQVNWDDRLQKLPTGIHSPETFRSMFFTPMRILLRNSKIFNSGMYLFKNKVLKFASSIANSNLSMLFIGETIEYKENDIVPTENLFRPFFKNGIITFNHSMNSDLNDLINGTTRILINGEYRYIPNFYFKFEWLNEKDEYERGYFLKVKNDDLAEFDFQLSNEEII